MEIKLLTKQEFIRDMEHNAAVATLICHANTEKEFVPSEVLTRIIKLRHESILEHINLTFSIKGLSRACLQELARHRHISLSVESTRHTLRKYATEDFVHSTFSDVYKHDKAMGFVIFAQSKPDMPNDELKYYLPEFWPTNLIITLNIREFRHILNLRTAPAALKEFRFLARGMFNEVPDDFKYLLQDCVHEEVKHE